MADYVIAFLYVVAILFSCRLQEILEKFDQINSVIKFTKDVKNVIFS